MADTESVRARAARRRRDQRRRHRDRGARPPAAAGRADRYRGVPRLVRADRRRDRDGSPGCTRGAAVQWAGGRAGDGRRRDHGAPDRGARPPATHPGDRREGASARRGARSGDRARGGGARRGAVRGADDCDAQCGDHGYAGARARRGVSAFDPAARPGSTVLPALACPICGSGLVPDALPRPSSLRCPLGHSADVARQGYASLLRGRHATSGDTAAMVQARADLLGSGHYQAIQDAVAAAVPVGARLVVDLGCGTGAYLAAVLNAHPESDGLGLDLSAPAARRAARAHPRAAVATADLWQPLPLADSCADALLTVFAPRNAPEMRRVLRPGGVAVVVTPRERHLHEIRERFGMLGIDAGKAEQLDDQLAGLSLRARDELDSAVWMSVDELRAEVLMGPSAHHVDPATLDAQLAGVTGTTAVTIAVTVSRFVRIG
ncbi:hypothetical protein C5E02_00290 [Rathayibacter rathayi]|nr:hypothetical protein C5C02_02540 [Rathayibacter rathayi]PPG78415.1 hypothetical protein C5C23_03135 [Rathayibacter rathayi]PPG97240.1 hypothetical protein C5C00_07435 [Rathayibacter rathayi]PPH34724.1 hypothetical protein C5C28_09040 [Rathayibacter rathayi]PPH97534.1 hypothetical protein C5C43_13390 [Rathayibacter rathayi]